jgi:hypothetical protein
MSVNCTYCGLTADSRDHVVPYSWNRVNTRKNGRQPLKGTVPCCRACNSKLGNKLYHTIEERKAYIAETLATPSEVSWDEDELEKLGPSLRSMVEHSLIQQERLRYRRKYAYDQKS